MRVIATVAGVVATMIILFFFYCCFQISSEYDEREGKR